MAEPVSVPEAAPSPAPPLPKKTAGVALALLVLGLLTPAGYSVGTVALLVQLGAIAVLVAVVLGVADHWAVGDRERIPAGLAAAAAFVAWGSLGLNVRSVLLVGAAVVLVREAIRQRATGPVEPGLAWRGGWRRRVVVVGAVGGALVLSAAIWDFDYLTHRTYERNGYVYSESDTTEADESAHSRGIAGVPLALLGLCVLACVWRDALNHVAVRLGVIATGAYLAVWAWRTAVADQAHAETYRVGRYGTPIDQGGAVLFGLLVLVMLLGAVLLLVRPPRTA